MPGEQESGDLYLLQPSANGTLLAVVDGAGHGTEAAAAARMAVATLKAFAGESPIPLLLQCHKELQATRGVVMTLAFFHHHDRTMTWLGVGNVEGVRFRPTANGYIPSNRPLLLGGLVGHQLPPLRTSVLPVRPNDIVILATDGIRPEFADRLVLDGDLKHIADQILARHRTETDDALVVVARYLGGNAG
jgi:serine/threonine protein phosphatase PrpC